MNRKRLAKLLPMVLALTLVLSVQAFAAEITVTGSRNLRFAVLEALHSDKSMSKSIA